MNKPKSKKLFSGVNRGLIFISILMNGDLGHCVFPIIMREK